MFVFSEQSTRADTQNPIRIQCGVFPGNVKLSTTQEWVEERNSLAVQEPAQYGNIS